MSALHPRWLIDGPVTVDRVGKAQQVGTLAGPSISQRGVFTLEPPPGTELINETNTTAFVDRLQDNGREILVKNLRQQQQFQRTLNGEDAEWFALLDQCVTQQLQAQFTHERQLGIPREFQCRATNNYQMLVAPPPIDLGPAREDSLDRGPEAFVTSTRDVSGQVKPTSHRPVAVQQAMQYVI